MSIFSGDAIGTVGYMAPEQAVVAAPAAPRPSYAQRSSKLIFRSVPFRYGDIVPVAEARVHPQLDNSW